MRSLGYRQVHPWTHLDQLFSEFLKPTEPEKKEKEWNPPMDIIEKKGEFVLVVELPGWSRDSLEIDFDQGYLSLKGEYSEEEVSSENRIHTERMKHSFHRKVKFAQVIDIDNIQAFLDHGVLTVHLVKQKASKAKEISVQI